MKKEKHGLCKTKEYYSWDGLRQRCKNPNNPKYKDYGGRGIKVCERWDNSFVSFFEDMGKRPSPKHQLDRIDNNGDYTPDNCHWVTVKENCRKTRRNKLTEETAFEIRVWHSLNIHYKKIAKLFDVSPNHIYHVVNQTRW